MKGIPATFQEEGRANVIALSRAESGKSFNRQVAAELTEPGETWVGLEIKAGSRQGALSGVCVPLTQDTKLKKGRAR